MKQNYFLPKLNIESYILHYLYLLCKYHQIERQVFFNTTLKKLVSKNQTKKEKKIKTAQSNCR